jgi:hypothetical protein
VGTNISEEHTADVFRAEMETVLIRKAVPISGGLFAGLSHAEARIRAPCGICGDKVALGQVFLRVLQVSAVSIIPLLRRIHSSWGWIVGLLVAAVP